MSSKMQFQVFYGEYKLRAVGVSGRDLADDDDEYTLE